MTRRFPSGLVVLAMLVATPMLATGQTLTELGAANAARNQMMGDSAQAAAGAQPAGAQPAPAGAAAATKSVGWGGMKYTLSYALMLTLIGLGVFLVCRPSHRHEPE